MAEPQPPAPATTAGLPLLAAESLDGHLQRIRRYLRELGLERFPFGPGPLRSRLADFMETHLDEAIDLWIARLHRAIEIESANLDEVRADIRAATTRWIAHVRDPANVETYAALQHHARRGFIAQHPPSRFLASQMLLRRNYLELLERALPNDPALGELVALLDHQLLERLLHITDFFVEGREKDLAEQSESYRRSVEAAPTPILVADAGTGRVVGANPVAVREIGPRVGGSPGPALWDLHPEGERDDVRALVAETLGRGAGRRENLHLLRDDRAPLPVDLRTALIEFRDVRLVQALYVDLSERRRLELQLVQSEKMAAIGQLAAGIAHEIRNPLGIIHNALFDLAELLPAASSEVLEDLAIARAEMARVQGIIDNLLEFSRDDRGERHRFDLDELVRATLKLLDKYLRNSGVRVRAELGHAPPCAANPNGIRQVLLNLLTNAVHAMPNGGEILLRTGTPGEGLVRLEVADDGEGIPPERIGRIFDPFFTTKEPGRGTGLGLSLVHSTIANAGGSIRVDSTPGEGTRFTIDLPAADPASADEGSGP